MKMLSPLLPNQKPERRNTISEKAYGELRDAIITGRVKPGADFSETDAAKALGISRTPVREAFTRLFDEGLIEISPQTGTRVALIDMARVREAVFIRSTLESAVVARAAVRPETSALDELDMLIRAQERSLDGNDMIALHRADMTFHATLMGAFAMAGAWNASRHVSADMMRVQFLVGLKRSHVETIISEHRAVMAAIRAGDMPHAAALLASHITNVDSDQVDLCKARSDLFKPEGDAA